MLSQFNEEQLETTFHESYQRYKNHKAVLDYITNLQQENERLKLELSGYREAILRDDKLLGLQQRIEKTVEYINNNLLYSEDFDYDEEDNLVWQGARCDTQSEDLLNILNGKE